MILDDELRDYMRKAIRKDFQCWVRVEPQDLLNMEAGELSCMIAELIWLKNDLESGSRDVESMIKDLDFQIKLLDNVLEHRHKLNKEIEGAGL